MHVVSRHDPSLRALYQNAPLPVRSYVSLAAVAIPLSSYRAAYDLSISDPLVSTSGISGLDSERSLAARPKRPEGLFLSTDLQSKVNTKESAEECRKSPHPLNPPLPVNPLRGPKVRRGGNMKQKAPLAPCRRGVGG